MVAQHQSLLALCRRRLHGRTRGCWRRCASGVAGDRVAGRSRPGSSTTPGFRRRGSTRSAWRASTAVSSASRTIARSRCALGGQSAASLPVAFRLYLPGGNGRRTSAAAPGRGAGAMWFATKPQIALAQIRWACAAGLPCGVALMDAAYGRDARLRAGMTELGVPYVVGIVPTILMWAPGSGPRRMDKPMNNTGRRDEPELVSAKKVALGLPKQAWRTVTWREGRHPGWKQGARPLHPTNPPAPAARTSSSATIRRRRRRLRR